MGVVGQLTSARLRRHPARWLLLALGVALALTLPVVSAATGHLVASQSLAHTVEQLPAGDRTVIAAYGGSREDATQRRDDATVREGLSSLTSLPISHQMLFGELADADGVRFRLGASDTLPGQVRLISGRLPASCTPTRCEVVTSGSSTTPTLDPVLDLVVVGSVERTDALLLPGTFDPGPAAFVLLGSDPDALQQLEALERFPRGAGWIGALDAQRITALGVPAYTEISRTTADELALAVDTLVLSVPDDALLREDARAATSQSRFALIGGATAVLVLGFVLVAAAGLRREHQEAAALLRRRGASRRTLLGFAAAGVGVVVATGALLGAAAGWVAAWLVTDRQPAHPPARALATAAVLDALPVLVTLAVLAAVLASVVLVWPSTGERAAWHVVELVAVGCLGCLALVAARGDVGATTVDGDPLAAALPLLGLVAAALVTARAWIPLAAWTSRRLPSAAVSARIAAASGVRRPLRTVVTVGFVTAAVGTVVFAGAYRATLTANNADTAAYDVPTAARLIVGRTSENPLDVVASAPLSAPVFSVLRSVAGVRTSATSGDAVGLLGVEPDSLTRLSRWDRTVGASDAVTSARAITSTAIPGLPVPDTATVLSIPVVSWTRTSEVAVDVVAWIASPDGRERGVALTSRAGVLTGELPDLGPGRSLVALTLRENAADATIHQHKIGEGGTANELPAGRLVLGTPQLPAASWTSWSSRTAVATAGDTTLALDYTLTGQLAVVRPGLADRAPIAVLVDPVTASRGESVRLDLGAGEAVAVRVVGTLPRFPTMGPRFVVADRAALSALLDDAEPGSGAAREAWVGGGDATAEQNLPTLTTAPYDRLGVTTQDSRRAALDSDAVSQGAGWLLLVAAGAALAVGLLSLVLLVVGERRDDDGQLLAHEADGVPTSTLRWSLWLRAVAAAVPALAAGAVTGLLLTRAVTSLISVSANGIEPTPPLAPATGPGWAALVLGLGFTVALTSCALVVSRMLRTAWPARDGQALR